MPWSLLLVLLLCVPAWAGSITSQAHTRPYSAVLAIDATPLTVLIDYDGNGTADSTRFLALTHGAGDDVFCSVSTVTPQLAGVPLSAAATGVAALTFNQSAGPPVTQVTCVCAALESATIYLVAMP